jgi:mRNA-degrading endonuclease toxin of MazEF toxin-antitoxin module
MSCVKCAAGKISTPMEEMTDDNGVAVVVGASTCVVPKYATVADCEEKREYLNNSLESFIPSKWDERKIVEEKTSQFKCVRCQLGQYCGSCEEGARCSRSTPTISEHKLRPGYWNVTWDVKSIRSTGKCKEIEPGKYDCGRRNSWTREWFNPLYVACPIRASCVGYNFTSQTHGGCFPTTRGPLCALCIADHFRPNKTSAGCEKCTGTTVPSRIGILFGAVILLSLIIHASRRRLIRLRKKYGHAWKALIRIVSINLTFVQISTSLPTVIPIPWPQTYLDFLDNFSFVEFDMVGLLGLKCVGGDFWDFRMRIVVVCCIPVTMTVTLLIMHKVHSSKLLKLKRGDEKFNEIRDRAVIHLYDQVDVDQDGGIDPHEFRLLLQQVNFEDSRIIGGASKNRKRRGSMSQRFNSKMTEKQLLVEMKRLGATDVIRNHRTVLELTKSKFVTAAQTGKLPGHSWIVNSEINRVWAEYMALLLTLLFLVHAPISQRFLFYFACHEVGGRHFLRQDYSIECFKNLHYDFSFIVVTLMVSFTFLFPTIILIQLCKRRKFLRTPRVRNKYGFLYLHFRPGAEYWELHEVFRRLILTGFLVFVQDITHRAAIAIIVCIFSVASLNFFRPHPNKVVFAVAQISFLICTFKYLAIIFVDTNTFVTAEANDENNFLGVLLVIFDFSFLVASCFGIISVAIIMGQELKRQKRHPLTFGSAMKKTALGDEDINRTVQTTIIVPATTTESRKQPSDVKRRLSLGSKQIHRALQKNKDNDHVKKIESTSSETLGVRLRELEKMSKASNARLQKRLKKRSLLQHTKGAVPKVNASTTPSKYNKVVENSKIELEGTLLPLSSSEKKTQSQNHQLQQKESKQQSHKKERKETERNAKK